jgi:hypothetical protein
MRPGMQVFKAVRNGVQVVAVKIFTDQLLSAACSAQYGEELRREIFLLRSCHDRNVVQFLGAHLGVSQHCTTGNPTPSHTEKGRDKCTTYPRHTMTWDITTSLGPQSVKHSQIIPCVHPPHHR